jgi:hypothetical protein
MSEQRKSHSKPARWLHESNRGDRSGTALFIWPKKKRDFGKLKIYRLPLLGFLKPQIERETVDWLNRPQYND